MQIRFAQLITIKEWPEYRAKLVKHLGRLILEMNDKAQTYMFLSNNPDSFSVTTNFGWSGDLGIFDVPDEIMRDIEIIRQSHHWHGGEPPLED